MLRLHRFVDAEQVWRRRPTDTMRHCFGPLQNLTAAVCLSAASLFLSILIIRNMLSHAWIVDARSSNVHGHIYTLIRPSGTHAPEMIK
jgi:hypothetical protein